MGSTDKTQSDKFKDMARELEADTDEKRWEEKLKKVAQPIPIAEPAKDRGETE